MLRKRESMLMLVLMAVGVMACSNSAVRPTDRGTETIPVETMATVQTPKHPDVSIDVDVMPSLGVDGPLHAGEVFEVTFTGRLTRIRGGYVWVRKSGENRALLRSDGNPEIPMGFEEDAAKFMMLDDGISGATSRFLLPPTLASGEYDLCTANSVPETCLAVEVFHD